jgi:hypothetical protein
VSYNKANKKSDITLMLQEFQTSVKQMTMMPVAGMSQEVVAHACNLSYSGDRDQEDCVLKPALANSSQDLILKTLVTKKELIE